MKAIYFKNLDGLRGIAALLVVFYHCSYWFKFPDNDFSYCLKNIMSLNGQGGAIGVEFFFVLSGFLISYLLFAEKQLKNKIDVFSFYLRRVLRIWPLYFLTLLIGFFIFPFILFLSGIPYEDTSSLFMYSVFLANFDNISFGVANGILGVQWSVAVEEQFYLVWPLLFILLNRKFLFPMVAILLCGLSEYYIIKHFSEFGVTYYHSFSCAKFLIFGCVLAYFASHYKSLIINFFGGLGYVSVSLVYLSWLFIVFYHDTIALYINFNGWPYHLFSLFFYCFLILSQCFGKVLQISELRLLTWLGVRSYGIYLLHMLSIQTFVLILPEWEEISFVKSIVCVLFTILLSHFSYKYFESYFLKLKEKWRKV